jgi:hypothetical protein
MNLNSRSAALTLTVLTLASGCGSHAAGKTGTGSLPQGSEPVKLHPSNFTTRIDNQWLPMAPGSRWVYVEHEGGSVQRDVVAVARRTKLIAGIRARVVHDVVTEKGRLVEDTHDWFAQDRRGNVWYFGEQTKEYSAGHAPSTKGSWETGVKNAQPGVVMPAHPKPGLAYRQEFQAGEAEDKARVLSVDEKAEVPAGYYPRTVMTKDFTRLEPRLLEHKFFARGVGPVLTLATSGGAGREELVSFHRGRG